MDYSQSLNLPKTDFPMRANLAEREPEILKFWQEIDVYKLVSQKNQGRPKFILHDGPPYANGHIHLGHALNKVLKDIVVKYHTMAGYDSPYVPGWDTHGLPIEQQAIKSLGINRHAISSVEFRGKCKEYALKFVDIQREEFKRLGVRGDWENPYLTLEPSFEAAQIGAFGEMAKKGYIYKGLKPVYWCASCETALAEAEVEYAEKKSPSIYVRFQVKNGNNLLQPENTYLVIWTTTPWTLVANAAICLHQDFNYVLANFGSVKYILAEELLAQFIQHNKLDEPIVEKIIKGRDLEGVVCIHPFIDRESPVILGDHVTLEAGTGCVHTAPGHGHDDYIVGKKYNLPILSPVDGKGIFTQEAGEFFGKNLNDGGRGVIEKLSGAGDLLSQSTIKHQYPHCWRCHQPVFFRATEQWFASIDGFRQATLEAIEKVRWIPAWGEDRIHNMIANRGDWCISRQRTWGVPIPIFYCQDCGKGIINDQTISFLQRLVREHGADIWFARDAVDLMPEGTRCPDCQGSSFTKETDIMDVWFDSGTSHFGVLQQPDIWPELSWPADLYLEGSDQHRGWFNSSISTSVAVTGQAPYRAVLTHGFVVDEQGRKMSKSLGNVVDPLKVINQMGADILRLWVSSADYRGDLAASQAILKQMTESYRKIRNTCRFLLGNIYDFIPAIHKVKYEEMQEIDRWALNRLQRLVERVAGGYRDYEYHTVYHAVHNFCTVDMSALYLDISKDRLYASVPGSIARRSAQTVLYEVLNALVRLLVPVLAFTSEEIWRYVPKEDNDPVSVQLCEMPEPKKEYMDSQLEEKWDRLLKIRALVTRALEIARQDKLIGNSLEAGLELYIDAESRSLLEPMLEDLTTLFIVSQVSLFSGNCPENVITDEEEVPGIAVAVKRTSGGKCERCWNFNTKVGEDKEHPELCPRCSEVIKEIS
ncbi:MAG: isoleucine--tRNA ligase [Peptococcaceae bacterium]|nr:isoleucine--tRNA ligase [Peptococcaceae bacterium]